jgi:hypothetical protein
MSDERARAIAALRSHSEARFDEVREQRVWSRLKAARRAPSPGLRRRRVVFALAAVAATVAVAFAWRGVRSGPTGGSSSGPSALVLVDGSEVSFVEGTQIALDRAARDHVRLSQASGRARYDVSRRANRLFEVVPPEATVRVRGTSFDVAVVAGATSVHVYEGRVEVDDGSRRMLLGAGETWRVTARGQAEVAQPRPEPTQEAAATPRADPPVLPSEVRAPRAPDRESLLRRADAARRRDALDVAAQLYAEAESIGDPTERAEVAMLVARLESRRGHHRAAARAYQRCVRGAPGGPHAEDALAGAATEWAAEGAIEVSRRLAADYLARWPEGLHRTAMQTLAAP